MPTKNSILVVELFKFQFSPIDFLIVSSYVFDLDFKISRFQDLFENTQTYTSVTRGHFLNNIYIQDMTEHTMKNNKSDSKYNIKLQHNTGSYI